MRTLLCLVLFSMAVLSCNRTQQTKAYPTTSTANKVPSAWESTDSPDFFRIQVSSDSTLRKSSPSIPCRQQIQKAVCVLNKLPETPGAEPQCDRENQSYISVFQELHDSFPAALQRVFCSVRSIYVLDEFYGTAFAGLEVDASGNIVGAQVGIRRSVIDQHLTLATWATWKEDLSFGGVLDGYVHTDGLPFVQSSSPRPVNDFLYFVMAHEFGHILDFTNDVNRFDTAPHQNSGERTQAVKDTWSSLSWDTMKAPSRQNRFPYRPGLCFYGCDGEAMSKAVVSELYRGLAGSNFISTYAATNPFDDFAESLAYFLMERELGATYQVYTGQGEAYDIMMKLQSSIFARKYQYVIDFLNRSDLRYP